MFDNWTGYVCVFREWFKTNSLEQKENALKAFLKIPCVVGYVLRQSCLAFATRQFANQHALLETCHSKLATRPELL